MQDSGGNAGEHSTWLKPRDALSHISAVLGTENAQDAILGRLRSGVIVAYARQFTVSRQGYGDRQGANVAVPAEHWRPLTARNSTLKTFWVSGDFTVFLHQPTQHFDQLSTIRYTDVRLDPDGIADLAGGIPIAHSRRAQELLAAAAHQTDNPETEAQKGPRISAAALKAWFAAYMLVYQGTQDTEEMALKSARGAFPGKSVSRDQVRELRGAQKRGRKSVPREDSPRIK